MVIVISEIVGHSVIDFIDYTLLFIVIMIIYYLFKLLFHGDHKHLPNQNPWDWLKPHLPQRPITPPPHNPPITPPTPGPTPNPPNPTPPNPRPRPPTPPPRNEIENYELRLSKVSVKINEMITLINNGQPEDAKKLIRSIRYLMTKAGNNDIIEHLTKDTLFKHEAEIITNRIKELRKLMSNKNFKDVNILIGMNSLVGFIIQRFGKLVHNVSFYRKNPNHKWEE
jgi:hypothetical protein